MSVRCLPLLVAVLLPACTGTTAPTPAATTDAAEETIAELRAEVETVAEVQADADERLGDVLAVLRQVDEAVARLEQVETFDDEVADYGDVHAAVGDAAVDTLRDGYLEVADAVAEARDLLAAARLGLDDPWETQYLDAQDHVLVTVHRYAEAADRVAQLVQHHWPTYVEVDARIADFVARRGNYRDTEEARNALVVELDTLIQDLVVAGSQLSDQQQERRAAGEAVNAASADAITIYEQRP